MIRVHTAKKVHDFPEASRFSTEQDFNNLCIWDKEALLAVFADGMWVSVEFVDAD